MQIPVFKTVLGLVLRFLVGVLVWFFGFVFLVLLCFRL